MTVLPTVRFMGTLRPMVVLLVTTAACSGSDGGGGITPPQETGSVEVSVTTTGTDVDGDGYTATVAGQSRSVSTNGSATFANLAPGDYSVGLSGVAGNCSVSGANPQPARVTANSTTTAPFQVQCVAVVSAEMLVQEANDSLGTALFAIINDLDDPGDLDDFTFEPARELFRQAVDADPANEAARFGLSISTVFVLEDDQELRAVVDEWDAWLDIHDFRDLNGVDALGLPAPFTWGRATLPIDIAAGAFVGLMDAEVAKRVVFPTEGVADDFFPPTLGEHQDLLRRIVKPALIEALTELNVVDSPDFVFILTPAMQGELPAEADSLELDLTEVLALRAALEAAIASVDVALAYVASPSPWGAAGFAEALAPGSTFGTLAARGGSLLADAHARLLVGVDLLRDAIDFLEGETDDQSNDVIKYDPAQPGGGYDDVDDFVGSKDLQDARDALDDVDGSLQGPRTVNRDFGLGDVSAVVDISRFFLDPIPDLKTLLPEYQALNGRFVWTATTFAQWMIPDPTLGGILPNMSSSDELKATMDLSSIYEEFAPPRLLGVTFGPDNLSSKLIEIDPATGQGTLIGVLEDALPSDIASIIGGLYIYDLAANHLEEIDPYAGFTYSTIDVGATIQAEGGLTFRSPVEGFLTDGGQAGASSLVRFEMFGGSATVVTNSLPNDIDGIAFGPAGTLYGVSDRLYTIDTGTGAVTEVGPLGVAKQRAVGGLAFRADGRLFTVVDDVLYTVDVATGAATPVGPIGFADVSGIAFHR